MAGVSSPQARDFTAQVKGASEEKSQNRDQSAAAAFFKPTDFFSFLFNFTLRFNNIPG